MLDCSAGASGFTAEAVGEGHEVIALDPADEARDGLLTEAAALDGLLRVARAARVFPLVAQGSGEPVAFLPDLIEHLRAHGATVDEVVVPYEFQVGADRMLRIRR